MGLTKNRKLYVAGLALALGGLVLDKTLLRGGLSPGTAQASDLLVDAAAPESKPAPAPTPSENIAEIAQRLTGARERFGLDPANVPDAFFGAGLNGKVVEKVADLAPADRFRQTYVLHAVIAGRSESGQETGVALLETTDEKGAARKVRVQIGQAEDGWTLTAVDTQSKVRSATFNSDGCEVVLTLPSLETDQKDRSTQDAARAGR